MLQRFKDDMISETSFESRKKKEEEEKAPSDVFGKIFSYTRYNIISVLFDTIYDYSQQ